MHIVVGHVEFFACIIRRYTLSETIFKKSIKIRDSNNNHGLTVIQDNTYVVLSKPHI